MPELNLEAILPPSYELDQNSSVAADNSNSNSNNDTNLLLMNQPLSDAMLRHIIDTEMNTRYFDAATETILVLCYGLLITFGAVGNGLVIFVVGKSVEPMSSGLQPLC
ncbi:hypothetical protein PoB_003344000 [Plakobranchus ocellatus]|uniref:G-protein coupled receptors family 1 profile domain-containing protein n=1 Tax=Plakobranchus ocellatus TaxID=259542 RepID=A0AAV4AHW8_9GAST|nr:hypothetical protein PoB_003344000 [Plakobranchus ocellatus]